MMTTVYEVTDRKQLNTTIDLMEFRKIVWNDWIFSKGEGYFKPKKWLIGIKKEFDTRKVPEEDKFRLALR